MKQNSRILQVNSNNVMEWLGQQLNKSAQLINDAEIQQQISQLMKHRQDKVFYFFTDDINVYFKIIWDNIIQSNNQFDGIVINSMKKRQKIIEMDLLQDKLKIIERAPLLPLDYDQQNKNNKLNLLKQQSDNLRKKINEINSNLQAENTDNQSKDSKEIYNKLYSQQKIKQTQQYIKKQNQAKNQRRKKLQQQRKKQQELLLKKQAQIKQHEQLIAKAKRQQIIRKQKQQHQRRSKQKQLRQQRNTEYMRIRKSIDQKPPLYQKLYDGFSKRYSEQQSEKLNRMHSQRKHYLQHITSKLLEKHEKDYEQIRLKKQKQRIQRKQITDNQARSRAKVHSSYQFKKPIDPKQVQKQLAKQKIQKMKQYKSIVKQKFKPRIDEQKRKQLMNMIQQMDLGKKHVRRVKLENGSVMYQQLKPTDAKMIGMGYLQQTKQIAAKARQRKKQQKDVPLNQSTQLKKPINYLQQLRKNRPSKQKSLFVENKNMSFDDKIKKVMQQSQKLAEITKQNEMMLKFGKFKTSQQILACKQQIDQNYLDIVNMKLKLILSQQNPDQQQ